MSKLTIKSPAPIGLADIAEQAAHSVEMMSQIRAAMLSPTTHKAAPVWNLSQLAQLLNIEKGSLTHRMSRGDLPQGALNEVGNRRQFTLAEVRTWVREYRKDSLRPAGAEAVTVSIANFKGGVGKTTTAVTLAQGMSLLGHKVLVIDIDPQGSLTTLFGILPDSEVEEEDTILPLVMGAETSIRYAIRPTYWDGIDLVPAAPLLFGAEFALPARQTKEEGFEFWNVLNYGIDDVRGDYDLIVIDTPPARSTEAPAAVEVADLCRPTSSRRRDEKLRGLEPLQCWHSKKGTGPRIFYTVEDGEVRVVGVASGGDWHNHQEEYLAKFRRRIERFEPLK